MTDPVKDLLDELAQKAIAGDESARTELLRQLYPRMLTTAYSIMINDADAQDAAQIALIAINRSLVNFEGKSRVGTWAIRIATNAAIDALRRRNRYQTRLESMTDSDQTAMLVGDDDPVSFVELDESNRSIEAALSQLTEEFRTVIVLRDISGLDYAEIALVLEVPIGTVRSRLARGRAKLAAIIDSNRSNMGTDSQNPASNDTTTQPKNR